MESTALLEGKITYITGSTRGIGWATAQLFARHGAVVILNGSSDEPILRERVECLKNTYGVDCRGIFCDVADAGQVQAAFQEIFRSFKRLDVLVNNAGVLQDALLGMISEEIMGHVIQVNTLGTIRNLQAAARLMSRNNQGSIINLTSIVGVLGNEGQAVYSASKAALIGLTLSAAKELAPKNILVNAVAPGFIDTQMTRQLPENKRQQLIEGIRMGRIGQAEDVANAILFFASPLSRYVTGQVLGVDGGMQI